MYILIINNNILSFTESPCVSFTCENTGTCNIDTSGYAICNCFGEFSGDHCEGKLFSAWFKNNAVKFKYYVVYIAFNTWNNIYEIWAVDFEFLTPSSSVFQPYCEESFIDRENQITRGKQTTDKWHHSQTLLHKVVFLVTDGNQTHNFIDDIFSTILIFELWIVFWYLKCKPCIFHVSTYKIKRKPRFYCSSEIESDICKDKPNLAEIYLALITFFKWKWLVIVIEIKLIKYVV